MRNHKINRDNLLIREWNLISYDTMMLFWSSGVHDRKNGMSRFRHTLCNDFFLPINVSGVIFNEKF